MHDYSSAILQYNMALDSPASEEVVATHKKKFRVLYGHLMFDTNLSVEQGFDFTSNNHYLKITGRVWNG